MEWDKRKTSNRAGQGEMNGGERQGGTISRQKRSAMWGGEDQDEHQVGGGLPGMGEGNIPS